MATKGTGGKSTCPMCFESRPLKIVGNCNHSYCIECLSSIFANLGADTEEFDCPSCKAVCPRPWNGVDGLNDLITDGSIERSAAPKVSKPKSKPRVKKLEKTEMTIDLECHFCQHDGKVMKAANLCVQCGNLCFCVKCTEIHARNKATRNHVVVALKREGTQCETHKSLINSFCVECEKAVCMMCVMFEHGDHTIEELEHVINTKVDEVKNVLEPQETRLTELECLEKELTWLKTIAPIVDRQDALIKDIEDHAQRCHDQITQWKDGLKKQVKDNFKVIQQIPQSLEKVSDVVRELKEAVEKARKIVNEMSQNPSYLDQLVPLGEELKAMGEIAKDVGGAELHEELKQVDRENHCFCPEEISDSCGKIETSTKGSDVFNPEEIFQHTMEVDSKDKEIQSVAVLGRTFAIAHPSRREEPADAIDIYELPGTLKRTIRDHVYPLYDMSATPDGKIAVLSAGTREGTCRVKLFDPEVGYINATSDFEIVKPLSFAVRVKPTTGNLYVILSGEDQAALIVTDQNTVLHRCEISKLENPRRLACSRRFLHVIGDNEGVIYDSNVDGDLLGGESSRYWGVTLKDMTATIWDECIIAYVMENQLCSCGYKINSKKEYTRIGNALGHSAAVDPDVVSRVSTRAGNTVVSFGQTFKVYKH